MRLITVLLLFSTAVPVYGQSEPNQPKPTDFDFLEGEWTVVYNNKAPGFTPNIPGTWVAKRQAEDRVLYDEFRLIGPGGKTAALGATYRVFDFVRGAWDMRYVSLANSTPNGTTTRLTANWSELTAWREGENIRVDQKSPTRQLRITYYNISPNHFSWKADVSFDGGKTWQPEQITIEATRKQ